MSNLNPQTAKRTRAMLSTALGPIITEALADPLIVEIMVNPDGHVWTDKHGVGRVDTGQIMPPSESERIVRLVASHIHQEANRKNPVVSAELPGNGERFEGVLPPVSANPCFSIRKSASRIFTLTDYVKTGTLQSTQAFALEQAVKCRMNILIVGGTSSGKTTLANALLHEMAKSNDRIVILEDTRELRCDAPDQVALRTQVGRNGEGSITLADLVRSTLRLRPDRIIIGEVRGPEALDMLKAWNTGHPGGIATIHANSAYAGLSRVEQLILEGSAHLPRELIAEALDLIVFISGRGSERKIETVSQLTDLKDGKYTLTPFNPKPIQLVKTKGDTK